MSFPPASSSVNWKLAPNPFATVPLDPAQALMTETTAAVVAELDLAVNNAVEMVVPTDKLPAESIRARSVPSLLENTNDGVVESVAPK